MTCLHHRKAGTAERTGIFLALHMGRKDYLLGSHPLWEVLRSVHRMTHRPYIVGGFLMLAAYCWNMLRAVERTLPESLIEFRRYEQMLRLKGIARRTLSFGG
jgi:hypothetical protein